MPHMASSAETRLAAFSGEAHVNRFGVAVVSLFLATSSLAAADWPHWRGPLASASRPKPACPSVERDQERRLEGAAGGLGVSSPIVVGDRVYVTSQVGAGVRQPGNHPRLAQGGERGGGRRARAERRQAQRARHNFVVEAFARADGRQLWEHRMEAEGELPPCTTSTIWRRRAR